MRLLFIFIILICSVANAQQTTSGVTYTDTKPRTATGWTKLGADVFLTTSTDNVGIGSSDPAQKLVVQGTIGAGAGSAALPGYTFFSDTADGMYYGGSGVLGFSTEGIGRMYINNANVGIGTISPASTLDVQGKAGNSIARFGISGSTSVIIDQNGNLGINTTVPGTKLEIRQKGNTINDGFKTVDAADTVSVRLWSDGTNARISGGGNESKSLSLNGTGGAAGNVGIGTISPTVKFEVVGTDQVAVFKSDLSTSSLTGRVFGTIIPGEGFNRIWFYSNPSIGFGGGAGDRDVFLTRTAANKLAISSAWGGTGTASLVVTGNTGIGTTVPTAKLQVVGTGTTTATAFNISDSSKVSKVTVLDNGNVGIGSTSPALTLDVDGGVYMGGSTGNTLIENDGTMVFTGAATVWNDIIVNASNLRVGTSAPAFVDFLDGIYAISFTNIAEDMVYGSFELPHGIQVGSPLDVHLHWSPSNTDTGDATFKFQYSKAAMGTMTFSGSTTIDCTQAGGGIAKQHQFLDCSGHIDNNNNIGDVVVFKLSRPTGDSFTGDAFVHSIGFHYVQDTIGSRNETSK